jgi:hypothetical protein
MIDALCLRVIVFCEIIYKFWIVLFFEGSQWERSEHVYRLDFFHLSFPLPRSTFPFIFVTSFRPHPKNITVAPYNVERHGMREYNTQVSTRYTFLMQKRNTFKMMNCILAKGNNQLLNLRYTMTIQFDKINFFLFKITFSQTKSFKQALVVFNWMIVALKCRTHDSQIKLKSYQINWHNLLSSLHVGSSPYGCELRSYYLEKYKIVAETLVPFFSEKRRRK